MPNNIVSHIRSKTREEWLKFLREKWIDLRICIQENGEIAFVFAFIFGIIVVLAFKLFVGITVVALLAGFAVWHFAESESGAGRNVSDETASSVQTAPVVEEYVRPEIQSSESESNGYIADDAPDSTDAQ